MLGSNGATLRATYESELADCVLMLSAPGPLCERNIIGEDNPWCNDYRLLYNLANFRGGRRDLIRASGPARDSDMDLTLAAFNLG